MGLISLKCGAASLSSASRNSNVFENNIFELHKMCQKEWPYKSLLKSALGDCVLIMWLNPAEEMRQLLEEENLVFATRAASLKKTLPIPPPPPSVVSFCMIGKVQLTDLG